MPILLGEKTASLLLSPMLANFAGVKANNSIREHRDLRFVYWMLSIWYSVNYLKLNTLESVNLNENLTLFQAVENWLDRERDQLPLWLPVGIGFGIAIWQSGGTSIWIGVLVTSIALGAYSLLIPLGSRFRQNCPNIFADIARRLFAYRIKVGGRCSASSRQNMGRRILWTGGFCRKYLRSLI